MNPLDGKSRAELLELAKTYDWWHSIDLGEMVTQGVAGRSALTERALDQVDFAGKKVLDIGCWDGIWTFEAEKRGAREVYSVDLVSMRAWSEQATYQLAHKLLASKARYYPNLSVYDVGRLGVTDFDIVIYCGIYYHLQDPLRAFAALRAVMAEGAQMVVEGPVIEGTDRTFADFSGRRWFADDPTNWWIPTMACLREWLDCSHFDVTAEFSVNGNLAPPPASYPPVSGPASAGVKTDSPREGLSGFLRRLLMAEAAPSIPPAPARPEAQDRISLVARATSPAERLVRRARRQPLPSLSSTPGISPAAAAGFAAAAALYHRSEPWRLVRPDRTIQVECPGYSRAPVFLMVLGDRTADRGLVIYFIRPALSLTLQGALLGENITWQAFLAAFLPGGTDVSSAEAEAVFNEGHGYGRAGNTFRRPHPAELGLLEGCLRTVPSFVQRHAGEPKGGEAVSVAVASGTLQMTLSWLVEGEREL